MSENQMIFSRSIPDNVTIIVRSVGERTESLCVKLLSKEVSSKDISIVHKSPFRAALHESYKIGIEKNKKWSLVVDADVLINRGLVKKLVKIADIMNPSIFVLQTEMIDKFFGGKRVGGVKLYRTDMLTEAINLIPDLDNRPETYVIKNMHKKKAKFVKYSSLVCGYHDFEQFYKDIFRKGFTHGIKHGHMTHVLLPYWKRESKRDLDFMVLIGGYQEALKHPEELKLDHDEVEVQFSSFMKKNNIKEKPEAELKQSIIRSIKHFSYPPEYKYVLEELQKKGRLQIPIGLNDAKE